MRISAKRSQRQAKRGLRYQRMQACLIRLLAPLVWVAGNACGGRPVTLPVVCISFQDVQTVTSSEDGESGSLREAIRKANESPGPGVISFNLPKDRLRIRLRSPLPPIRDAVTINGFNQRGGRVELDGAGAGREANGLTIIGSGNTIQGLVIYNFSGHGVLISGRISGAKAIKNQVVDNFIGTDAEGIRGPGNGKDGVFVDLNSSDSLIARNRIARNKCNGVNLPGNGASKGVCESLPADEKFPPPVRIAIRKNLIFANRGIPIDLGNDGPTPNGAHKGDPTGPNNWQTFPVLTPPAQYNSAPRRKLGFGFAFSSAPAHAAETAAGAGEIKIIVKGKVLGESNRCYTVEFFLRRGCLQGDTNDTGSDYIGEAQICLGGNSEMEFTREIVFPGSGVGGFINATVTDASGNTSEFSDCVTWQRVGLQRPRGPYTAAGGGQSRQPYHHPRS